MAKDGLSGHLKRRKLKKLAKMRLKEARRILKKSSAKSDDAKKAEQDLTTRVDKLTALVADKGSSLKALKEATDKVTSLLQGPFKEYRKGVVREFAETIGWALLVALLFRAFIFESFVIPSGSMIPTLQINDHIFVSKFAYGIRIPFTNFSIVTWDSPVPGEIIVFEYPGGGEDAGRNFIKRVVAVAGDKIRLEGNVLVRNGVPLEVVTLFDDASCMDTGPIQCRCVVQSETSGEYTYITQHHKGSICLNNDSWPTAQPDCGPFEPGGCLYYGDAAGNPSFPDVTIPEGHVLVMGDNRDNSQDSRYWGLVPLEMVRGKASFIWWANDLKRLFSPIH